MIDTAADGHHLACSRRQAEGRERHAVPGIREPSMALWQRHAPVMSAQPSRGHDGAWWLRLNLMVLTLGLVVVVVLGSALWTRLQPADTTWPQPRAVTGSEIAARPEGHLFY